MENNTVLVVGGEQQIAPLVRTLESAGYQALHARCPLEGVRMAGFELPDLIYWDVESGGVDGAAACRQLKNEEKTCHIPIIAVTARGGVRNRLQGFDLGADDCISRSVPANELLARARAHLRRKRLGEQTLQREREKLDQVRSAQAALMPTPDSYPQGQFGICFVPVLEAGGDYYDAFAVDDQVTAYFVADVSGHDLAASFASPVLKTTLRMNARPGSNPQAVLAALNGALGTIFSDGKFVTACLAYVDRRRGRLTLANAGQPPAFCIRHGGQVDVLEADGDVLGVFPDPSFTQIEVAVETGDRLYLYTDGVTEALGGPQRNRSRGFSQLMDCCSRVNRVPIRVAVPEVIVQTFADDYELSDDFVLLGAEI